MSSSYYFLAINSNIKDQRSSVGYSVSGGYLFNAFSIEVVLCGAYNDDLMSSFESG